MGTTIGIIGLFVAIALLVVLAFKGHSVIIAAPIAALPLAEWMVISTT